MIKWQNLKRNKCPKCGKELSYDPGEEMIYCPDLICRFQISQYRAERLITQMNGKKIDYKSNGNNFADLQNLGAKEIFEEEPIREGIL